MKYLWGALLILVGIIFVGSAFGLLSLGLLAELLRFWPLILIFWGLDLLLAGNSYRPVILIIALILSVLFIYEAAYTPNPTLEIKREAPKATTSRISVDTTGTEKAAVTVKTGAIDFRIDGTTEKLVEGELLSNFLKADVRTRQINDQAETIIETNTVKDASLWWGNIKNEMRLKLNQAVPIDLRLETGASNLNLDLTEIIISSLEIKTGASSLNLRMGEKTQNNATVSVEAGVSSIKIAIPKNLGVRLTTETGLTGTNFDGFTKTSEGLYENDAYKSAEKKITISLKAGVSSLEISQY